MAHQPAEQRTHRMGLQRRLWDRIAAGDKTIEVRVCDAKRRAIRAGDRLCLHDPDGREITVLVTALRRYPSFEQLLDSEDVTAIAGGPATRQEQLAAIRSIYTDQQEAAVGALAVEVRLPPGEDR